MAQKARLLWRVPLVVLSLVLIALFFESAGLFSWAATELHVKRAGLQVAGNEAKELWIEVHDVSPSYGAEPLLEVVNVLDRHSKAYSRAVLLVIPNHGGSAPLSGYKEFTRLLAELERRGYSLGVHGYAHPDPLRSREFNVKAEDARSLVDSALDEFEAAGLGRPEIFAPPGWVASQEVEGVLRENFQYVYYFYYIDAGRATLPYESHEYTWYRLNPGLWKAKFDYARTKGVFRLSLHVGAVNSEENLKFLDDFLAYVESTK